MGGPPVESPARPSSGEASLLSLCCSVSKGGRGAGCLQWAGLGGRWCRGALSQLVNHCRATAISWLPIPGAETQGHSCWAGRGEPGRALSLLRCHLVVADGSVAAQVAGTGRV